MPAPAIRGVAWDDFLDEFGRTWEPGQHVAIIAPTGQGKTTVLVGILGLRKYVLALDPKGGDSTLASTGYPRLPTWPPRRRVYDDMNAGKPARFRVGPRVNTYADRDALRAVLRTALIGAFDDGGWTVAADEFQILADKMKLADESETLLIAARDKKVSMVTLFQRPANVPRAAAEMATYLFLGLTLDTDTVNRLAEMTGRPKHDIRGAISGLAAREFSWLIVPNNPRRPILVTVPRKAASRAAS